MQDNKKIYLEADSNIVCREEEDDALLFNPDNGSMEMLNSVGYEIWKLCDGTLTLEQIIEKLKEEYPDTEAEAVKKDTTDFIIYMGNLSLIRKINK